ncbi:hypothetical protein HN832_00930 [archaeon]|jgi:hypothetical protein|nr:hypothetical protein [archaeon]MBT4373775.1 hypothetical protein [archaeon]MBT4532241.1 hypothetical protein [archaeon]MBT7001066.1 hypothetical protein [archaeon]MBT7281955.1 hypothetical protein [archaeon]
MQILEIGEHRWFFGERVHHQVSLEEAAIDWVIHQDVDGLTEAEKVHKRFMGNFYEIEGYCQVHCGGFERCKGCKNCPLDLETVHRLLHDDPKEIENKKIN